VAATALLLPAIPASAGDASGGLGVSATSVSKCRVSNDQLGQIRVSSGGSVKVRSTAFWTMESGCGPYLYSTNRSGYEGGRQYHYLVGYRSDTPRLATRAGASWIDTHRTTDTQRSEMLDVAGERIESLKICTSSLRLDMAGILDGSVRFESCAATIDINPGPAPSSDPPSTSNCSSTLTSANWCTIGEGRANSSAAVSAVQSGLNRALGTSLTVDGRWGTNTRSAVLRFQVSEDLTPDGVVGRGTATALAEASPAAGRPATTPTPVSNTGEPIVGHAMNCLDIPNQDNSAGRDLQMYDCNESAAQQWTVRSNGQIEAMGLCLAVENAPAGANGIPVELASCGDSPRMQWEVTALGQVTSSDGRCLDVRGAGSESGTPVQVWECTDPVVSAQQWVTPGAPTLRQILFEQSPSEFKNFWTNAHAGTRGISVAQASQDWRDSSNDLDSTAAEAHPYWDFSTDFCSNALDTGLNFDFKLACVRHDFAYRNLVRYSSATERNKDAADAQFSSDMEADCVERNPIAEELCSDLASTYFLAVNGLG